MKLLQPVKVAALFTLSHALPTLLSSLTAGLSSLPVHVLDHPSRNQTKPVLNAPSSQGPQRTAQVEDSNNWSGMVLNNPPSKNDIFSNVSAEISIPHLSPNGSANYQAVSIWVGIDGASAHNAILQTGVQAGIINGQAAYNAWYQWYPNPSTAFQGFNVDAGDVLAISVHSLSPSSGVAIVENKSTGKRVSQTIHAPDQKSTLSGQNAEWIVEDFQSGNRPVPLVNFGKVNFSECQAQTGNGQVVGVAGGSPFELMHGSKQLSTVQVDGDQKFVVQHT